MFDNLFEKLVNLKASLIAIFGAGSWAVIKDIDYLAILSVIALITNIIALCVKMYVQIKANHRDEKDHQHKHAERKRADLKQAATIYNRRKDDNQQHPVE